MKTTSFEKNKNGIFLMIISSIVVCLGQLLWKLGANGNLTLLGGGFLLYGLGALLMIIAYKFGSLSVLQPILSLNYVISLFVGYYFLNESVSIQNLLGVIIIILGVYLIATGDWKHGKQMDISNYHNHDIFRSPSFRFSKKSIFPW